MPDVRHEGRYRIPVAARLVGLHPSRVRRWLGVGDKTSATVIRHESTPLR